MMHCIYKWRKSDVSLPRAKQWCMSRRPSMPLPSSRVWKRLLSMMMHVPALPEMGSSLYLPPSPACAWHKTAYLCLTLTYVCPEPVLANARVLSIRKPLRGKTVFSHLFEGGVSMAPRHDTEGGRGWRLHVSEVIEHLDVIWRAVPVHLASSLRFQEPPLFEPFIYKSDHFTKTGSGQT